MRWDIIQSASRMSTVSALDGVVFRGGSLFVYSRLDQQDRENVAHWHKRCREQGAPCWAAVQESEDVVTLESGDGRERDVNVGDLADLRALFPKGSNVVIDISGLGHDFWAGCLEALSGHVSTLTYIYTEPREYQRRPERDKVGPFDLFDLSPRTMGPRPLSGFLNLGGPGRRQSLFVPLLGFEGQRTMNVLNEIDPGPAHTVPVIGVPGYQIEFPAYTAYCNQDFFETTGSHRKWRSAPASDPFAVKSILGQIRRDYPDDYLYIAPIGTRPHALGAMLYAREQPELCEILFDRPVSRKGSRMGRGPSHLYCITP